VLALAAPEPVTVDAIGRRALSARGDVTKARHHWQRALNILDETGMPGADTLNRTTLTQLLNEQDPRTR
jgi:hypothetical protein